MVILEVAEAVGVVLDLVLDRLSTVKVEVSVNKMVMSPESLETIADMMMRRSNQEHLSL